MKLYKGTRSKAADEVFRQFAWNLTGSLVRKPARRAHKTKITNAGADGPEPVRCDDCGWRGKRVYPRHAAFDPKPCPNCQSKTISLVHPEPAP